MNRPFRVGVALLSSDLVLEPELHRVLPTSIATYVARVAYPERVTEANLDIATQNLSAAMGELRPIRPELVAWACTSGSFFRGHAFNHELRTSMSIATGGVPAITASSAVIDGLRALGARTVSVLTPYSDDINVRLRSFLEESGFGVAGMHQLYDDTDMDDFELQSILPDRLFDAATAADVAGSDTLLVSCTGVPLLSIVADLESQLGKPVIGSNLALMRSFLVAAGHTEPITDCGRLIALASTPKAAA